MWQPGWEEVWERMDTCICMAESLCCPSETITMLLVGYSPYKIKSYKNVIWVKCYCKVKEEEGILTFHLDLTRWRDSVTMTGMVLLT